MIGTLICFTGALVEVIYLGPFIRPSPSSPNSNFLTTISHYFTFFKNSDNWALGSLLLACATLSISIWNIIQVIKITFQNSIICFEKILSTVDESTHVLNSILMCCLQVFIIYYYFLGFLVYQLDTVQKYPQVMKVVSAYSLAGTLQCAIFSAFMEPDLSAWKLELNMDLYLIIATVYIYMCDRMCIYILLCIPRQKKNIIMHSLIWGFL